MTLNQNSILSKFYRLVYFDNLSKMPDNFCTYFWGLIFSPLIFILSFPAIWARTMNYMLRCFIGALFLIISIYFGIMAWNIGIFLFLINVGIVTGIVLGSILAISGIILIVQYIQDKHEIINIMTKKIDSFKNKYCPRIEWKK